MLFNFSILSTYYLLVSVFWLSGCNPTPDTKIETPVTLSDTTIFMDRVAIGTLIDQKVDEASGLAISILNPHHFWTHNDSGDKARLFMINDKAEYIFTLDISDITNRDWEDIAIAKDPVSHQPRIYIGDIGDNNAQYPNGYIYIIDEPFDMAQIDITIKKHDKITFQYPDGRRDAECLMVDPTTGDIYIVSKRESNVNLYKIPYPYNFNDIVIAEKLLTLPLTQVVAGDISYDGSEILIKNYVKVYHWKRKKGQSISEALSATATEPPYIQEPQGESICWSRDAKSFYTISESSPFKVTPVLYRYDKK
ncbi:MAG: hypothetical protein WBO36_11685 [Saprospiraceae bacterium]